MTLVGAVGYGPEEPIVIGVQQPGAAPLVLAQGLTPAGERLRGTTLIYAASLAKQMTAACAALLVRRGMLDMDSALSHWLPELPAWADTVRLRHLVHHTAALPDAEIDTAMATAGDTDRTTQGVLGTLSRLPTLDRRPGTAFAYSGAGYVCLAVVVQRAAGQPLPDFARGHLFGPLKMAGTSWPESGHRRAGGQYRAQGGPHRQPPRPAGPGQG